MSEANSAAHVSMRLKTGVTPAAMRAARTDAGSVLVSSASRLSENPSDFR